MHMCLNIKPINTCNAGHCSTINNISYLLSLTVEQRNLCVVLWYSTQQWGECYMIDIWLDYDAFKGWNLGGRNLSLSYVAKNK